MSETKLPFFFATFAPDMYSLKEAWIKMHGSLPADNWDGRIYCCETDAAMTFRTNKTHGVMAAHTFTLVTQGWLTVVYNGQELTLHPRDLYIYSPGMSVSVVSASADYRGICLLLDEHTTIELPTVHDLVYIAYQPVVQLHEPKLTLPDAEAAQLKAKMHEIIGYLHSPHIYKYEVLKMLCAIFLLDMQNAQDKAIAHRRESQRVEEIFISFIRLLPQHYAEHHDIGFYADRLSITPTYLSRIVRRVAGRTVMDYVNQFLVMEASFLLRTSQLSITQVADRLHFADAASFSKFFLRHKGVSPRDYRNTHTA